MGQELVYLAEITAYDPGAGSTTTLRYSTHGFVTSPSESPANTFYDARIKQPAIVKRDLYQSGTTSGRSRLGFGDLLLANDDGALDALLKYAFDGRAITVRMGERGAAYPSGFQTVLAGTMEQAEFTINEVRIKIRDKQFDLQIPLQPTKYAGSNSLPAGLEGVEDIKGKPKPVLYGSVTNVPAVCVNTSKLIYQVAAVASGLACNAVDMVYDRGVALAVAFPLTMQTSGTASGLNGAAYGAGLYAVGGAAGTLLTSPDGTTWTSQTSNFGADEIYSIAYANGLFVAVGTNGKLSTSTNGTAWTARTSSFGTSAIQDVAFGNGTWLIGGAGGKIATSTDGTTWTSQASGVGTDNIVFVARGVTNFVIGTSTANKISSSPDGVTWTARTSSLTSSGRIGFGAYGNGTFVALASDLDVDATTRFATVLTSTDGVSWTRRDVTTEAGDASSGHTRFLDGMFVSTGAINSVITSPDGITWTARQTGGFSSNIIKDVASNGDLMVFVGAGGKIGTATRPANYASQSDLLDDSLAPPPGMFKAYPTGGYFRLGSSPAGLVTADVTQGASASVRTAAQIWKLLIERAGKTSSDYSAADITALDTINSSVIGYFADEETTFAEALDEVAGSVGAWWGPDKTGIYRIQQFGEIPNLPVYSITANEMVRPLERISTQDEDKGIPAYRVILKYSKNYAVQTTDLAAGVTDDRRTIVGKEWREASYTDSTVQTRNLLAVQMESETLLTDATSATAEATRRQKLRGRKRDRYALTIPLNSETEKIDLGSVVRITHSRFSLSGGECFRVMSVDPDAKARRLALTVWGPHAPPNSGGIGISLTLSGTGTVA